MRPIHLNIHTWGSGEQEKPRNGTRSGFSSPLPRLPAPLLEAQTLSWKRYHRQRAPRPALSRLCGGQKKRGFIAPNIGPLCAAFLALCWGTASVYMAALNRAGTLHSSERPLCKCQRDTLSSHRRLPPLPGTPCVTGKPGISCPSAPGTTRGDLVAMGRPQWPQRARLDGVPYGGAVKAWLSAKSQPHRVQSIPWR